MPPKIMKLVSKEEFFYPQKLKQTVRENNVLQKLDEGDKIWVIALGVFIALLLIALIRKTM